MQILLNDLEEMGFIAITSNEAINKYVKIDDVEQKEGYLYITLNLIYNSEIISNMEDALNKLRFGLIALQKVLVKNSMNQDLI